MNSSSSKILHESEHGTVAPIQWRETAPPKPTVSKAREPRKSSSSMADDPGEQQEREQRDREAYQRGFTEGKSVGHEQATRELQAVLDQMGKSLASLSVMRTKIRAEAEGDLLKLAISIARRVLHRELTLDPESIEGLIRVALEKLQSRELCRVRVHPDQESAIRASLERFSNSQKVELTADPSMQCGDVLFETAHGNLDASIEAQLQEIERGFADRLGRRPQQR